MISTYDPAYCEQIIAWGREGGSIESFAGQVGVVRKTLYNWRDNHPEFDEAAGLSLELALGWWEATLKGVARGSIEKGSAPAAIFGVKNRAGRGQDGKGIWRDVVANEVSGPDGEALTGIAVTFVKPAEHGEPE